MLTLLLSTQFAIYQGVKFSTLFHLFGRFKIDIYAALGIQLVGFHNITAKLATRASSRQNKRKNTA